MIYKKYLVFILFAFSCVFIHTPLHAASIKSVKGNKVLIDLETSKLKVGDVLSVVGSQGKVTGAVKISAIKGKNAEANLKGKAAKGNKLRPRTQRAQATGSRTSKAKTAATPARPTNPSRIGGMIGYNSISSDVVIKETGQPDVNLTLEGSGISLKGFYDYNLFSMLWFRGLAGLEQFNIGGQEAAQCGGECLAEINYLTADLWGRFVFGSVWLGGGFSLLLPISKESTAFNEDSISTTSLISAGGGLDLSMGNSILPIQVEYNIYPSTERVKATSITVRVGYGF